MAETKVLVEKIDGIRISEKATEDTTASYTVDVSLSERARDPMSLSLNFELTLTGQPKISKLVVSGVATITGTKEEIQSFLRPQEEKGPPLILVTVYERVYGLLYLISHELKIPYPMPGLISAGGDESKGQKQ
jgi:hypothetical protein